MPEKAPQYKLQLQNVSYGTKRVGKEKQTVSTQHPPNVDSQNAYYVKQANQQKLQLQNVSYGTKRVGKEKQTERTQHSLNVDSQNAYHAE